MKESRKSSYKNLNIFDKAHAKRSSCSLENTRLRRDNFFLRKRSLKDCSNGAIAEQKIQMTNTQSSGTCQEELGFVTTKNRTIGHIPCCKCSIPILPNGTNMCAKCLNVEVHINDLPSHVKIEHCPNCVSYLKPPKTWVKAERDSKELLSFCLGRLKKLSQFRLVDARLLHTEPNSKRIKLKLKLQREVLDRVYVETSQEIEYVVFHRMCPSCMPANQDHYEAVVQMRQYVPHMRTLKYLEGLIIKHGASDSALKIKQVHQGLDFFFPRKSAAVKFFDFLSSVAPVQPQSRFHKQLVSQDLKSNISRYKYNIAAVISPICRDDLIYLSPKLSSRLGQIGPLVICTKVRNKITLLNPFTLKFCTIGADQYWRAPFEPILSTKQLVLYIVLDVVIASSEVDSRSKRYALADVEIARVSDFGKNDRIISVRTHLGHLLKPGDHALGYDLYRANFNNSEAEQHKASFPDAVLIQKTYLDKSQRKTSKHCSENKVIESDYNKQILSNLENLSLYESVKDNESHEMDSITADAVSFSGLEEGFADLYLSDDDSDGCITDAE